VSAQAHPFDAAFIEKQRQALLKLRAELVSAVKDGAADEAAIMDESSGGPREYEDEAQKLATLELEGSLVVRDLARLRWIDRALQKIEEGTYGLSDLSAEVIPRKRLEAAPESIFTLEEEQALEARLIASR
jgi:DnaK suppressor protein